MALPVLEMPVAKALDLGRVTKAHTAADFERWVANSPPGSVCEYARGTITVNKGTPVYRKSDGRFRRTEVAQMAWELGPAVLTACEERGTVKRGLGVVELVQRRLGEFEYSYLAIKRERSKRAEERP